MIQNIRKYINIPRNQYVLMKDELYWYQLCSALDIVEDTSNAAESYFNLEFPNDVGYKYLLLYGVLQALFIQQDAIKHISEVIGFAFESSVKLIVSRNCIFP